MSGRVMFSGGLGDLPVDYTTGIARAPKPDVLFKPANPLIVREELGQPGGSPNLGPSKRPFLACKCDEYSRPKILVGHHAFARPVPPWAPAFRANARFLLPAATRNPLVAAPFAAVAHNRNRDARHIENIRANKIFGNILLPRDARLLYP